MLQFQQGHGLLQLLQGKSFLQVTLGIREWSTTSLEGWGGGGEWFAPYSVGELFPTAPAVEWFAAAAAA